MKENKAFRSYSLLSAKKQKNEKTKKPRLESTKW